MAMGPGHESGDHAARAHAHSSSAWTKSHVLEGDGLLTLLFHHLWKKNKSFQSCPGVKLPDTVIYEHNFPRAWYMYDFKNGEISKRSGRFLDTHHIYQSFSRTNGVNDVCAQYLFTTESDAGPTTSVEFMTPKELEYFLNHRKVRPDGILQRFLPATDANSQVQVIWSPRITLIQRRVNKCRMHDRNIPAYQRCVTFDGPSHYTDEGLCSERTKNQILRICSSIVDHFHSTEHKQLTRFVLYFKVSSVPKQAAADGHDTLWLLWASSLRIGDSGKFKSGGMPRPLNLSPNVSAEMVSADRRDGQHVIAEQLAEVDRIQCDLTCGVFTSSPRSAAGSSPRNRSRSRSPARARSASPASSAGSDDLRRYGHRPASAMGGRSLGGKRGVDPFPRPHTSQAHTGPARRYSNKHDRARTARRPAPPRTARATTPAPPSTAPTRNAARQPAHPPSDSAPQPQPMHMREARRKSAGGGGVVGNAAAEMRGDDGRHDSDGEVCKWWTITPEISRRYEDLEAKAKQVRVFIDDLIYSLYSHFLRKRTDPLFTVVPEHIKDVFEEFGEEKLALILAGVMRMTPYDPKAGADIDVPDDYMHEADVWYASCDSSPPFGMQCSEAHAVFERVLEYETTDLKKLAVEKQQQKHEASELEVQKKAMKAAKSRMETSKGTRSGARRNWRSGPGQGTTRS